MPDLERFTVDDLVDIGAQLRELEGGPSMAAVASEVVALLHGAFCDGWGQPGCADVQLRKTHPFGGLPEAAKAIAAAARPLPLADDVSCLTTLAYAGSAAEGAWGVEPLAGEPDVLASPFLRAALPALHISPAELVDPTLAQSNELHRRPYGLHHVADAREPDGIRSVVAIGGGLLTGEIFLLVVRSRVVIDERVARLLKSLTPAVKTALVPMTFNVFDGRSSLDQQTG